MSDIEIVDIIDHRHSYGVQVALVLNRMPRPLFERHGTWLIGLDSCIWQFYYYEKPSPGFQAFAGAEFDIPMADGSVTHADGQWWGGLHKDFDDGLYGFGIGTVEGLEKCNVFMGGVHIERAIVDQWRLDNEPSNNYHKYDKRHADFGKHRIVSQWEAAAETGVDTSPVTG